MKRYILLLLLSFQIVFSQEIVVKGQAFNSGKFNDRVVYIIKNDTINKLRKHSDSLYEDWKRNQNLKTEKIVLIWKSLKTMKFLLNYLKTKITEHTQTA